MNILYHHRTQAEDAQGIHIQEMISAFRALGHAVTITALVKPGYANTHSFTARVGGAISGWAPAWVYELMSLSYNLVGYSDLCRVVKHNRPDVIYERYSLNTLCGIWASRRFGIPLILEVNAPLYYEQQRLGRLSFRRLALASERWICSNATRTITVTAVMKRMLEAEGVPSEKIVVMPNGVDPESFNPGVSGASTRARYGLNGKVVIGFVGWFRPWHGLEMLLQAVREVDPAEKNLHVMLVGDGPTYQHLHDYCESSGMLNAVTFTGPVARKDLPAHIAAMDVAVQPSATEYACPMKIVEYMAMEKCIIAPDQENIRELVGEDGCAILFAPGNTADLRAKLLQAIQHPDRRVAAARAAYARLVDRDLFWRTNAQRVLSILDSEMRRC